MVFKILKNHDKGTHIYKPFLIVCKQVIKPFRIKGSITYLLTIKHCTFSIVLRLHDLYTYICMYVSIDNLKLRYICKLTVKPLNGTLLIIDNGNSQFNCHGVNTYGNSQATNSAMIQQCQRFKRQQDLCLWTRKTCMHFKP